MTITEINEKIMNDKEFVKLELNKFSIYYNLKHTIRWARTRNGDVTESVAEHIYGMHVLSSYFLPLIDNESKLNHELIHNMITWHDMAEAIVSDMTTKSKTEAHKASEKEAEASLTETATDHLQKTIQLIYSTYDDRSTEEAKFVKALDKIEPMFHIFFLKTKNVDMKAHFAFEWEANEYREYRAKFVDFFNVIKRFDDILYKETFEYFLNN